MFAAVQKRKLTVFEKDTAIITQFICNNNFHYTFVTDLDNITYSYCMKYIVGINMPKGMEKA